MSNAHVRKDLPFKEEEDEDYGVPARQVKVLCFDESVAA